MTIHYRVHTPDSAPDGARQALQQLEAAVGVIPNLAAAMAESPELLKGFLALRELYAKSSFSPADIQVLSLTAAYENSCAWCMAFHTGMALKEKVDPRLVDDLRAGRAVADTRWGALSEFARTMVRTRGNVGEAAFERFIAAGFSSRQALEVVLGMGMSMLANYAGHLTKAPLDGFLQPHTWSR